MTDSHLVEVLTKAFLAPNFYTVYSGRWDTWLINNGHMEEFVFIVMKTDGQLNKLLHAAETRAAQIKNSPLSKALRLII